MSITPCQAGSGREHRKKSVVRGKVSPVSFVVLIAVCAVGVNVLRDRVAIFGGGAGDNTEGTSECPAGDPSFCDEGILAGPNAARVILQASETCKDVGYLCAELEESDVQRTYRWPDGTARLRIRIPPPPGADRNRVRDLQRAAVRGFQYWSRKPFELIIDSRTTSSEPADITVSWNSGLSGSQLGVTRVEWRFENGEPHFRVHTLTLATRNPMNWRQDLTPQQILLTAAHEMGHALGVPHSDSPRDVMYPTDTARSLSTRDFRTLDALYNLPNGAEIRKN